MVIFNKLIQVKHFPEVLWYSLKICWVYVIRLNIISSLIELDSIFPISIDKFNIVVNSANFISKAFIQNSRQILVSFELKFLMRLLFIQSTASTFLKFDSFNE